MSLKYEVDKIDEVPEGLREMYVEDSGKFRLKIDGLEDTGALKRAKDHEKSERQKAIARARELEERLATIEAEAESARQEAAKKAGDVGAIEKTWQEKLAKVEARNQSESLASLEIIRSLTVGNAAQTLAAEIAIPGSAKALLPHIEKRITLELRDGQPSVIVLGTDGKPSGKTMADLRAELESDPAFAPLLVASRGAGSGGAGGRGGGGTSAKSLAECRTPADKAAWLKANNKIA